MGALEEHRFRAVFECKNRKIIWDFPGITIKLYLLLSMYFRVFLLNTLNLNRRSVYNVNNVA